PEDALTVPVERHRGYAAVPFRTLERIGWGVALTGEGGEARRAPHVVRVREGSPLFSWDERLLQLTHEPYRIGGELWVPLQLLSDFLPERLPDDYGFEPEPLTLRVLRPDAWTSPSAAGGGRPAAAQPSPAPPSDSGPPVRVVVIDPGHGGADPGARGPGGTLEKDVALAFALALAAELERHPGLRVHLTRSSDRRVPPWERGEWATGIKGDRP